MELSKDWATENTGVNMRNPQLTFTTSCIFVVVVVVVIVAVHFPFEKPISPSSTTTDYVTTTYISKR